MKRFPTTYPVTAHTDHVGPGSTFVAIQGLKEDGTQYILQALTKGATTIVVEEGVTLKKDIQKALVDHSAQLRVVSSTRRAVAELSAEAYGYPAQGLKLIGITGTKGKTTTSYILEHILRNAGIKTARIGTVKNRILDAEFEAPLTTPQPDYLHTFFSLCKQQGVEVVIMEVAAQALSMQRVATLEFDSVVFTNFSLEHSEFYSSLDEYFSAKCRLFDQVADDGLIVLNADDKRVARCVPEWPQRVTFGMHKGDYIARILESSLSVLSLEISTPQDTYTVASGNLLGTFSAYNLLACCAVAERFGIDSKEIKKALGSFDGVPGRLNRYKLPNGATALVDTAHTPSSYEALLKALRPLSNSIIVVFGAGGDRDAHKRPLMGALAVQYADQVILTTDNPRSEDVGDITAAILTGIDEDKRENVSIELDREKAIRDGYAYTAEGALLVLLGKGPDEYQEIDGEKIPFSEVRVLRTLRSQ